MSPNHLIKILKADPGTDSFNRLLTKYIDSYQRKAYKNSKIKCRDLENSERFSENNSHFQVRHSLFTDISRFTEIKHMHANLFTYVAKFLKSISVCSKHFTRQMPDQVKSSCVAENWITSRLNPQNCYFQKGVFYFSPSKSDTKSIIHGLVSGKK